MHRPSATNRLDASAITSPAKTKGRGDFGPGSNNICGTNTRSGKPPRKAPDKKVVSIQRPIACTLPPPSTFPAGILKRQLSLDHWDSRDSTRSSSNLPRLFPSSLPAPWFRSAPDAARLSSPFQLRDRPGANFSPPFPCLPDLPPLSATSQPAKWQRSPRARRKPGLRSKPTM